MSQQCGRHAKASTVMPCMKNDFWRQNVQGPCIKKVKNKLFFSRATWEARREGRSPGQRGPIREEHRKQRLSAYPLQNAKLIQRQPEIMPAAKQLPKQSQVPGTEVGILQQSRPSGRSFRDQEPTIILEQHSMFQLESKKQKPSHRTHSESCGPCRTPRDNREYLS